MQIAAMTALAMLAFAANSVLARLALALPDAEPMAFTGIRLASGAVALWLILWWRQRDGGALPRLQGSWAGAAALFFYAILFSIAYLMLGAGMGALILFACVQFGMLGWAVFRGDRPGALEWAGIAVSLAAFFYLVSPGLVAPHPFGAALMALAGLSWAAYSLIGRGSTSPLADTAGNFVRCLPVALVLIVAGLLLRPLPGEALIYAVLSGVIASGVGYAIWYAALPGLSRVRASIVQLSVPAIAALGGALLIGESLTPRLIIASLGILGGVALAIGAGARRRG